MYTINRACFWRAVVKGVKQDMLHKASDWKLMMLSLGGEDRKRVAYLSTCSKSPYVGCYNPMVSVAPQSMKRGLPSTAKVMALSVIREENELYPWRAKRPHLADRRDSFEHFNVKNNSIALARALTLTIMPPLHEYMMQLMEELEREVDEDEEDEEDEGIRWPDPSKYFIDIPQKVSLYNLLLSEDYWHGIRLSMQTIFPFLVVPGYSYLCQVSIHDKCPSHA